MTATGHHVRLAIELHTRTYPDVAATALLLLRSVERLRRHDGYENARQWGHGPHHEELRRLGLVTLGKPQRHSCVHPVDLTDDGRIVAHLLEGLRRGALHPVRCRCCGFLSDNGTELCWWCGGAEVLS